MLVFVSNNSQAFHRPGMWKFTLITAGLANIDSSFISFSPFNFFPLSFLSSLCLPDQFIHFKRTYSKDGTPWLKSAIPSMISRWFPLFVASIFFFSFKSSGESRRIVRWGRNGKTDRGRRKWGNADGNTEVNWED